MSILRTLLLLAVGLTPGNVCAASFFAGSVLANSVQTKMVGDQMIVTNHWSALVAPLAIGLGMLGLGLVIASGRLKMKAKRLLLGALLILLGLAFSVGPLLSTPYERVTADRERLVIHEGVLGQGFVKTVVMEELQSISVSKAWRRTGTSHARKQMTIVKFTLHNNETVYLKSYRGLRQPALEHFLRLAAEAGIPVEDLREEEEE